MISLDLYKRRLSMRDDTARERWLKNTQTWISRKLPRSLSYHTAIIDGEERQCAILSTQNDNEKKICSMPGEYLVCGTYVEWMGNFWLITELNAPNEVYQTALMIQCNYELRWVNDCGEIISRWVNVIDGTKYLTGEYYQAMMTVGDSRMQLTMPRDDETVLLNRGERFLIDDPSATEPQAYEITKINRTGKVYNGHGVFVHMLSESNRNDNADNYDMMIADYYTKIGKYDVRILNALSSLTVDTNSTFRLDAIVFKDGVEFSNAQLSYFSSDESVAVVSEDGIITPVSGGECDVVVSYYTFTNSVHVCIGSGDTDEPSYIVINSNEASISVGSAVVLPIALYVDKTETELKDITVSLDCADDVATALFDGGDVILSAGRDRKNIGTIVTLTISSDAYAVSTSRQFTIRGWT